MCRIFALGLPFQRTANMTTPSAPNAPQDPNDRIDAIGDEHVGTSIDTPCVPMPST